MAPPGPPAPPCVLDFAWLAKEGELLGGLPGTPRYPAIAGGAGLVGSNLLLLLANSPLCEKIRVVDMLPPAPAVLKGIEDKVEFVQGRFGPGERERLTKAVFGCDCIFMVFTPNVHRAPEQQFYLTNVNGVEELTRAAIDAGVKRIVYTSSIAMSNMMVESFHQAESDPLPPLETYQTPYDISKRKGEELLFQIVSASPSVKACALRFAGVLLGPYDFFFAYVWPIIPGLMILPLGKPVDFMDGRDVVRALMMASQALEVRPQEVAGEAFWCTGVPHRPGELGRVAAKCLRYPFGSIPDFVTTVVVAVLRVHHSFKKMLGLPLPGVRPDQFVSAAWYEKTYNQEKAKKAFGFEVKVPLEEAVSRVVDLWLLEKGYGRGPGVLLEVLAKSAALAAGVGFLYKTVRARK
mmetsp:Transcript_41694/g.89516  ORF Transcript_41694/g.89516 Transcript_41694/m.89516 type:complete len:407 (+) Transcript_41694:128-1348(+)